MTSLAQMRYLQPHEISPKLQPDGQCSESKAKALIAKVYSSGDYVFEWEHIKANGEHFLVEVMLTPIEYHERSLLHVVWRDITRHKFLEQEQRELQGQLQQAQKMETMGQLTGGIAHDFNNILAAILGYTRLSLERHVPDKESKLAHYLQEVQIAGERARDQIANMLAFSRGAKCGSVALNAASLIKEVSKTMRSILPTSIELKVELDSEIPPVLTDPVQLHQILMNLAINARDAIDENGVITISLRHPRDKGMACSNLNNEALGISVLSPNTICASCQKPIVGRYVELSVADTGLGIPDEILPRIFEPFFSTKEISKGSGMGLAMVHGIVHEHEGHILIDTVRAKGTRIRLMLQIADQQPRTELKSDDIQTYPSVAVKPILIIDDEKSVGSLISEILSQEGFTTVLFDDSISALAAFEANPDAFSLVITDQTMPKMTGSSLAQRMLSLRSGFPIILCTGYSDRIDETMALQLGIKAFLLKPIAMSNY